MKLFHWLLCVLVLGLAAWWAGPRILDRLTRSEPVELAHAAEEPALSAPQQEPVAAPVDVPDESARRESVEETVPVEEAGGSSDLCRVFGRITDEQGVGIEGVGVVLKSTGGPWAEDVRAPETTFRGRPVNGFRTSTDSEGRFLLETPLPTSDWISLYVEPGTYHSLLNRNFGPAGGRDKERLQLGDNDLGDLSLATTGEVRGTVLTKDGDPVANAEVRLMDFPGGLVVSTGTGADGRFVLGHVPPGTCRIEASKEGWQDTESGSIQVLPRQPALAPDLVMAKAPTISGVVVDEDGAPVPGVRLWAWPSSSGSGAGVRSGSDGTFVLQLPQDEAYVFDFEHEGFLPYDRQSGDPVQPGTTDHRLVLERGASIEFQVLDAASGAPIERYGLRLEVLERGSWSFGESTDPVPQRTHPDGRCKVLRKVGEVIVHVEAPGYALADLEPTAEERQTVELVRGQSVSGRVVKEGEPVPGARVEIRRSAVNRPAGEEVDWSSFDPEFDLTRFVGRTRRASTEADGGFRFDHLAAGTYAVRVTAPGSAPLDHAPVVVAAQAVDVGELALRQEASITGRLVLPPDRSALGWVVNLDGPSANWSSRIELEADGRFRYEGLLPGRYAVQVSTPGGSSRETVRELDLAVGDAVQLELDVSHMLPANVTVLVTRNGVPQEGVRIRWTCTETKSQGTLTALTDDGGRTSGDVRPSPSLRMTACSTVGIVLGESELAAGPGARVEGGIELRVGSARLVLPAEFDVPEVAGGMLFLRSGERSVEHLPVMTPGHPMAYDRGTFWRGDVVELGLMLPGEYDVSLNVQTQVEREIGGQVYEVFAPYAKLHGKLVVRVDAESECPMELVE